MRKNYALIVAVGVLALVTGCGVTPTGVVGAGPPGVMLTTNPAAPTNPAALAIYLLDADNRPIRHQPSAAVSQPEQILTDLFGALPPAATQAGMHSDVTGRHYTVTETSDGGVVITLDAAPVSEQGLSQIACTATQPGAWSSAQVRAGDANAPTQTVHCPRY